MTDLVATLEFAFRVIDAFGYPHGGRILRLRLVEGHVPTVKELKDGTLVAASGDGEEVPITIVSFAVFGGVPSDDRLARTGRIDLRVAGDGVESVITGWTVTVPA